MKFKGEFVPETSRFLGIVISMFFDDHNPPHFHAKYNEHRALISINGLNVIGGSLLPRVLGLVTEWAELHKGELLKDWELSEKTGKFFKIDPLV